MDMQFREIYSNQSKETAKEEQLLRLDTNFLVIGPAKSGKSSLMKTMYFALNSNINADVTTS